MTMAGSDATDFYAVRLARVDAGCPVISIDDIQNERGTLIVRKGSRIDRQAAERILRHRLVRPLEEQVALGCMLDVPDLEACYQALFAAYPDLDALRRHVEPDGVYSELAHAARFHPVFWQKLTVLRRQLPREFEKALFCAWLATWIARLHGLPRSDVEAVFIAAIGHDFGMLHLSPALLAKGDALTPAEWHGIQRHVDIGRDLLRRLPGVPPLAVRAVAEHHERCDGTGYPRGLEEKDLCLAGQILAMADSIQAIRVNQFGGSGRTLANVMPFLQLNTYTHFESVYRAAMALLKRAKDHESRKFDAGQIGHLLKRLPVRCRWLRGTERILERLLEMLEGVPDPRDYRRLLRVAQRVRKMITQAGLAQADVAAWVEGLSLETVDQETARDLDDLKLMAIELHWQIRNLVRVGESCLAKAESGGMDHLKGTVGFVLGELRGELARWDEETGG